MDSAKVFKQTVNDYLEGNIKSNGIIVPNNFNIYKTQTNDIISKIGNKSIVVTEKILQDFTIVGNYVWNTLKLKRSYLSYAMIGYIAQTIHYNSNIIKLSIERMRGYLNTEIGNRDYYTTISYLRNMNIIGDCDIKGCFVVNPIAVYKGNIYKYVDICETNGLSARMVDEKDRLIIDKIAVIKDKYGNDIDIILNRANYKESIKEIEAKAKERREEIDESVNKRMSFSFAKRRSNRNKAGEE